MCIQEQLTHNDGRKKHHKKSQHLHAAHSYVLPAGVFEFDSSAHWYSCVEAFKDIGLLHLILQKTKSFSKLWTDDERWWKCLFIPSAILDCS